MPLYQAMELQCYRIHALDGALGSVKDLYFEDSSWIVRYFVVATGAVLKGRRLLLSASNVMTSDEGRVWSINITQEQARNSPPVESIRPVTRPEQGALHAYFGWPRYWGNAGAAASNPARSPTVIHRGSGKERDGEPGSCLHSVQDVRGFRIMASDGPIGHVDDLLVDLGLWDIRFLVIDTRKWLPGRKVLVSPQWIESMQWSKSEISLDLSRDEVKDGPPYDAGGPITQEYTDRLLRHFGPRRTLAQRGNTPRFLAAHPQCHVQTTAPGGPQAEGAKLAGPVVCGSAPVGPLI